MAEELVTSSPNEGAVVWSLGEVYCCHVATVITQEKKKSTPVKEQGCLHLNHFEIRTGPLNPATSALTPLTFGPPGKNCCICSGDGGGGGCQRGAEADTRGGLQGSPLEGH